MYGYQPLLLIHFVSLSENHAHAFWSELSCHDCLVLPGFKYSQLEAIIMREADIWETCFFILALVHACGWRHSPCSGVSSALFRQCRLIWVSVGMWVQCSKTSDECLFYSRQLHKILAFVLCPIVSFFFFNGFCPTLTLLPSYGGS